MSSLELKIPPPVVGLSVGLLMWLASRAAPGFAWSVAGRTAAALALVALGVGMLAAGIVPFVRAHTTANPLKPEGASTLVMTGIFRFTRNPMYLGLSVIQIGWAVFLANAVSLVLVSVFVLYINRFQIGPEEKVLSRIFGAAFTAYRAKVRRWL